MLPEIKQLFLEKINGPVFPVLVPFTENGELDIAGLQKYVEFLLDHGARTLMVTVGTSRFDVLTIDEMKKVNETVAKTVNGRAVVIVTTPTKGPTKQAIDFAKHAESVGADGILAVYPDRYYSEDHIQQYFAEIAGACSIGILIHLMSIPAGRGGLGPQVPYSPSLVDEIANIENVVGIKEESHDQGLSYKYSRKLKEKIVLIGGAGGMRDYLTKHMWGQQAYLVGIGNFVPDLEIDFYNSIVKGDIDKARKIVFDLEEPFFEVAVKAGWHLALKEALAHFDLMQPWERLPTCRISAEDRSQILNLLKSEKWTKVISSY